MTQNLQNTKFLFYETDSRYSGLIRLLSGIWFFVDVVSMLVSGYVSEAYVDAKVNLSFYGFEWVHPLDGLGMYFLFIALALMSIAIAIGYRTKMFTALFIAIFSYVFLIDVAYTLNKFYLFLIIASLLLCTDESKSWKFPNLKQVDKRPVAYWNIFVFQALLGLIYFYSGIAKINHDWLYHAQPLHSFFQSRSYMRALGEAGVERLSFIFSYCGIVFDLTIAFVLINRKTRVYGQIAQVMFHTLNFAILHIGSLSIFMMIFTLTLFPTNWVKKKLRLSDTRSVIVGGGKFTAGLAMAFVILFTQLIIPHRHYLSGANVNWTEKGHRFSWRLMSRTKGGSITSFKVVDNDSDQEWSVNPKEHLTGRQYRKMSAESDLILFFAHYLKKEWAKKGFDNVSIYVRSKTRLNHRKYAPLIDREKDLAKVSRTFLVDRVSESISPCHEHP